MGRPKSMKILKDTRESWATLGTYQKFEQIVALVLTLLISVLIVISTWNLLIKIGGLILLGFVDPTRPEVFQAIFGMIMIVLISLEFNHSLIAVVERGRSIIQVRTVLLIALLAVLRKFIIFDISETSATKILALSVAVLALGGVYWAVRDQDRREGSSDSELM